MTKLEEKLKKAKTLVNVLLNQVPTRTLNDKNKHIVINNEDMGTLQECINKYLYEIWEIKIKWD